jgi:ABC-type glycerol-3-phosphate transport system permease component
MGRSFATRLTLTSTAAFATLLTLFPIAWMAFISLKTHRDALRLPPEYLFTPTLAAFAGAWQRLGFAAALANSLIVSALALAVSLFCGGLAAYAISRYRFRGAQTILCGMLVTRIFPPVAIVIPFYLNLRAIDAQDTHWGLALAYVAINTPLATWMLKGYFDAIPRELEDCAMVDGCSRLQAVLRITLPLMAPGVVVTAIFVFVTSWNEFLFALILTSREARTLPVVIAEFVGDTGIEWPQIMAAAVIALTPILIATFALQRHIASGLTAGALKG